MFLKGTVVSGSFRVVPTRPTGNESSTDLTLLLIRLLQAWTGPRLHHSVHQAKWKSRASLRSSKEVGRWSGGRWKFIIAATGDGRGAWYTELR